MSENEIEGWREAAAEHLGNEQKYRKKLIEVKDTLVQKGIIDKIDEPDDELIMKLPQLVEKAQRNKFNEDCFYENTEI